MNRHQSNPLLSRCVDQSCFTHEVGVMAKPKVCIDHRAGRRGFDNLWRRVRLYLLNLEVFQVQMHVTQTHVTNALSFGIRNFGRYDIRLFLARPHVEQCISTESLYLRQGHDWHSKIPAILVRITLEGVDPAGKHAKVLSPDLARN